MHRSRPLVFSALAFGSAAAAQHDVAPSAPPTALTIAPASREGQDQIATFALAPGLACDLVAAEPDLCNPVAFAIDGMGRFYVVETFRINDGVFDTRSYMQWKDRDLACLTVADRLAKYRDFIPNDIPKFAAIPERVRLLVDTDKNGTLDRSTVFATSSPTSPTASRPACCRSATTILRDPESHELWLPPISPWYRTLMSPATLVSVGCKKAGNSSANEGRVPTRGFHAGARPRPTERAKEVRAMRDHPPSSKFQAPSSHLSGGGKRILVLPILLISASLVVAQNPPAQVVHVATGPTTPPATDLEAATYFTDTTVTQSTANPVVVSDLVRIRRDNIVAAGSQVPAAMGQNNATTSLPFAEHDLGSPAGGGIAIEDRARINIVGKTPAGFPYLVWPPTSPEARGYLGSADAVRTSLDMVPDISQSVGVGRTDGTGQNVPIVSGANGGTTPTTNLSNYGRQINVTPPGMQRIMIDWEGGLNNPCAVLVDRPPFGSNIVAAFLHYGIPANPLPFFTHPLMPGVALWTDPLDPLTTSISQIFFPGTDQSVRFPLTLPPGTGHVYVVQAVCMLSNSTFAGSPGMVFRF